MSYYLFRRSKPNAKSSMDWYPVGRPDGYADYPAAEAAAKKAAEGATEAISILELKAVVNLMPVVTVQPSSDATSRGALLW